MKRKSKVSMIVRINMVGEDGVISSYPAAALFDAEIEWLPMEPGLSVVGTVPLGFKEISIEDEASGEAVRFVLT